MPPESEVVPLVVVDLDPETPAEVQPVRRARLARVEKRRRVFMVRLGFAEFTPLRR
jgi:hypothetical protein